MRYFPAISRPLTLWIPLLAGLLLASSVACTDPSTSAEVTWKVDDTSYDYKTAAAEVDQQVKGGAWSVYLMHDQDDPNKPWLGIRTYSGNPVARLFLRYRKPDDEDEDARRWECFVPGKLSDGRDSLTWRKADGGERIRQETGDADCTASVVQEEGHLAFKFDARVRPRVEKKKKKGKAAPDEAAAPTAERVHISGQARVALPR